MPISYLRYDLQEGYIHNWLVAGPQSIPIAGPTEFSGGDSPVEIARQYHMETSGITEMPVERGPLSAGRFKIGDYEGAWTYVRCQEDHFVDLSDIYPTGRYVRAWAYAQVEVEAAQTVRLVLTTYGPVDLWVNETEIHRQVHFEARAQSVAVEVSLAEGRNTILVRFEQIALGACTHAMALGLKGLSSAGAAVILPTTIEPVERRNALEKAFSAAYLDQDVYERDQEIRVRWQELHEHWPEPMTVMLRDPAAGRIYAETPLDDESDPQEGAPLGQPFQYPEGHYTAVLMPPIPEYGEGNMRISRALPLWALDNNSYSDALYGEFVERRVEALRHAAPYRDDVYAEMAKMAIQWWSRVEARAILQAIEKINNHHYDSVRDLLGVLGMHYRFGSAPEFPKALTRELESAILGFRYVDTDPDNTFLHVATESTQLLLRVCELLAGQQYPERIFSASGETGLWHQRRGQELVMAWLQERAARGFEAWDSDIVLDEVLAALIHLIEFAEDEAVYEMATAMMDKTLFTLALNTHKGLFGSSHGVAEVPQILHGMLEATSGINRLMWGTGAFNHHTLGTVSLACAENYGFPRLIQAIAAELPEELWSRQRYAPRSSEFGVDKVTYRTPDYMLSSAQDHRPGQEGSREHIWQATMGPGALVFVNHPTCASVHAARRPNYWRGNGSLPRVAQWKDTLIAVYSLPEDDWMGFTHAYFPAHAFDEHVLQKGWAFARKGNAYLALTASRGLEWMTAGTHPYRELRSYGHQNIWLCQMGRKALDGTFAGFQESILSQDVAFEDRDVRLNTLRGEILAFGWEGPLVRDGETEPITGFHHFESPYGGAELPAEHMIIVLGEQALRLDLK